MRFNGQREEYWAYMAASMIPNGLLPANYYTLSLAVQELSKNGAKEEKATVKVTGPLNSAVMQGS